MAATTPPFEFFQLCTESDERKCTRMSMGEGTASGDLRIGEFEEGANVWKWERFDVGGRESGCLGFRVSRRKAKGPGKGRRKATTTTTRGRSWVPRGWCQVRPLVPPRRATDPYGLLSHATSDCEGRFKLAMESELFGASHWT